MLPRRPHPFKLSKAAVGLVIATVLLGGVLTVNTLRNIDREERLMQTFLLREGLTVIRAFEAGARASLRHMGMMRSAPGADPLDTLATETAAEEDVLYIRIADEHGTVLAEAGAPPGPLELARVREVLAADRPLATLRAQDSIFEVARPFQPLRGNAPRLRTMRQRWQEWCRLERRNCEPSLSDARLVIFVGLSTTEFLQTREQDLRHSLIMGAILFLVGSAGLYFIFLYQEVRVARATLADMEQYTDNVIQSMPAGLVTIDPQGRLVSCNRQAVELLGEGLAAGLGRPVQEALDFWPPELARLDAHVHDLAVDWPRADGAAVPVKIHASRLCGRDGRDLGLVIMLQDMRRIREMEERLERSRRLAALGKVAAGVAHEIRNPLGTLRGFAQYFASHAPDEASREYADLMIGEVDRLNHTVSALLQFARPRDPVFRRVEVRPLLDRAVRLLAADLDNARLTCTIEAAAGLAIAADPDLILQVILNCVKNAVAASQAGSEIHLRAAPAAGQTVVIEVRDQGRGMNEEERRRMFDPFYTTRPDGTGLGLAVSHQIVEQHRGRFEVASTPGAGTTVRIILPAANEEHEEDDDQIT